MVILKGKKLEVWLGGFLVILGVSMMVIWFFLSQTGKNSDQILQPTLVPSATTEPDLLIPTRTPNNPHSPAPSLTPDSRPTMTATLASTLTPDTDLASEGTVISTQDYPKVDATANNQLTCTSSPADEIETTVINQTNTATPAPMITENPDVTPSQTATFIAPQGDFMIPRSELFRIGVSLPYGTQQGYGLTSLGVGWVMDWNSRISPQLPSGIEYVHTVSLKNGTLKPDAQTLSAIASANPGATWLISNEPDVRWQNNVTPDTYARLYHDAYFAIKGGDPGAIIAAGGIAQPSPLRLTYLDMILQSYQTIYGEQLPAQAWHIHNYMLREERDTWGVDIPPGISADSGLLYTIDDSGNLQAFRIQIYDFRRWMVNRGYAGRPLIVSEFGIPMPPDYGFGIDRVSVFLRETWRFFYTTTDPVLGSPSDGGRLVQRWCWFSLGVETYPSGNIIDPASGKWTSLANIWRGMVEP